MLRTITMWQNGVCRPIINVVHIVKLKNKIQLAAYREYVIVHTLTHKNLLSFGWVFVSFLSTTLSPHLNILHNSIKIYIYPLKCYCMVIACNNAMFSFTGRACSLRRQTLWANIYLSKKQLFSHFLVWLFGNCSRICLRI